SDKLTQCVGREHAINPAVPFSKLCVIISRAQHDLERPGTSHEPREVLYPASARHCAKCRLRLSKDGRTAGGKAHVARQHELAAGGAYTPLDLRDGDQTTRAQMTKHQRNRCFAGQLRSLLPVLLDVVHVYMGNEIVR